MDNLEEFVGAKKGKKGQKTFYCESCDYICSKIYSWDRHLLTSKHKILHNPTSNPTSNKTILQTYSCKCGKLYKHSSTLYAHKKLCDHLHNNTIFQKMEINVNKEPLINEEPTDKSLMMMLIKEQSDIKQIILEIVKNGTYNNNNNTINSHNKAFNLNFFLNETCKNAMNITEFVDSIKLELSDLMELGEIGYVAGMSKIITKNLNALDETIRPIHCTDTKRETFYVKDEDKWEKEDVETKKLKKLIFRLSNKSIFQKNGVKHPLTIFDSIFLKDGIIIEAMMCDPAKDDKIIRNISKITAIAGK